MSVIAEPLVVKVASLNWRQPWLALSLLWIILFVAAEMSLWFTTGESFRVVEDDTTNEERADYNVDAVQQGSLPRQVGLLALAGFGAVGLVIPAPRRLRIQGLTGALALAFLGSAGASIIWSSEPLTTLRKLMVLGALALGALGVARQFSLRTIVRFTIVAIAALFVLGVASELALGTLQIRDSDYRFSGLTWPAFSAWMLSLLILAVAAVQPTVVRHRRALWLLASAALIGLIMTRTRASAAGLAAGMAAFALLTWPARRTITVLLALVAAGAVAALALELTVGNVGEKLTEAVNFGRAESVEGVSGRWDLWRDLAPFVAARPLTGYGYDSFWTPERLVQIGNDNWGAPNAHNGYLDLALGVGLVGAAAFVLLLLAGIGRACRRFRATGRIEYAFACSAIIVLAINVGFVSTQLSPAIYSFITLVLLAHLGFIDERSADRISRT